MDSARRNEIAYLFLKDVLKQRGFPVDQSFRRRSDNAARRTGVEKSEMLEFSSNLAKEIVQDVTTSKEEPQHGHGHDDEDFLGGGH
ncbi:MAG: hypothetical protein WAZ27_01740 [Minisyncoccia bacterium]